MKEFVMKKVILSCFFLVFGFIASQVSLGAESVSKFDCSFSVKQLEALSPQQFAQLPQEKKVELAILYKASETDQGAAELILSLPLKTFDAVARFATNVPPVFNFCDWEDRKSARGEVLKFTLKAMAMGFVTSIPEHAAKHLLTGGLAGAL
jgi:hypothetical protein